MLEVRNVDGFYGNQQVLWDVSFRVARGEIVVLIGSNGSGKSSVLKAISGLLPRVVGTIFHEGLDLVHEPAHQRVVRKIGFVLERRRLFPQMTVTENLMVGAHSVASPRIIRETHQWIGELLPIVKVKGGELAARLSGGEQQQVAIARGLMSRPELLLMDEPFLGLSPRMVGEIASLMRRLNQEGLTILFNEQNVAVCSSLADRAYLLKSGRIALEVVDGSGMVENADLRTIYLGLAPEPKMVWA